MMFGAFVNWLDIALHLKDLQDKNVVETHLLIINRKRSFMQMETRSMKLLFHPAHLGLSLLYLLTMSDFL